MVLRKTERKSKNVLEKDRDRKKEQEVLEKDREKEHEWS